MYQSNLTAHPPTYYTIVLYIIIYIVIFIEYVYKH